MIAAGLVARLLLSQVTPPGALGQLADSVAAQVRGAGAEAPVAVSVAARGQPALQQAFSTLLLGRLADLGLAPSPLPPGDDDEALTRARGARTLVRVRLTLDGTLTASGDVLSTWVNFWSGRTLTRGRGPAAVLATEVHPDALVRALVHRSGGSTLLLDPRPLVSWPVRTAALAAGDLDGDGRPELAVLTAIAVEVYARDGRLLARRSLDALPRADPPSREPFGTLLVCDRLLFAFSAGRSQGEVLALLGDALAPRSALARPVVACGHPPLEAPFVPGVARLAIGGGPWPELPARPLPWGASARPGPTATAVLVQLDDGTARWGRGMGALLALPGVGAGAALGDVGGDGTLRLLASSAAAAPAMDRLRLLAADDGGERAAVEIPGRILQVVAADLDADGTEDLVVGVWRSDGGAELRVVRSAR